jgi:hypothetical protein
MDIIIDEIIDQLTEQIELRRRNLQKMEDEAVAKMKSRAWKIKNKLRSILITANQRITDTTMAFNNLTHLTIPKNIQEQLKLPYGFFLVRKDFVELLDENRCRIKDITAETVPTPHEVINVVYIHLESYGLDPADLVYDLKVSVGFSHYPHCGIPNLLVNGYLLTHLQNKIVKAMTELEAE